MDEEQQKPRSKRGFALMDPEKQRAIASMGGRSVPAEKRSFAQNTELAAKAGQKGGRNLAPSKRTFARDPSLASAAGKKGGHASHSGGPKRKAP
jgi:general stress protein YciG